MAAYLVGTRARVSVEIRNLASGALYDPPSGKILCVIQFPPRAALTLGKAKFTYTYPTDSIIVKDDTGKYHIDLIGQYEGTVTVNFQNTHDGNEASEEADLTFRTSKIG